MTTAEEVTKPKKQEHTVRLSDHHTAIAQRLAQSESRPFAEILTDSCVIGLDALVERNNRANIWQKTSSKAAIAGLLDQIPADKLDEVIQALRQMID